MAPSDRTSANYVTSLFAKSSAGDNADVVLWADPSTHALLTQSSGGSGGTAATDNSAFTAGTTSFTPVGGFYHATIDTVTDGRAAAFAMTSKRGLIVTPYDSAGTDMTDTVNHALKVNLVASSVASGGTSATDNSAFTAGTTTGTPMMGFYHSTIDAVTDNRAAVLAMDAKRSLFVVIRDAAGNARGLNIDASGQLAITVASGGIASGAIASGAIASGAVASGAFAAGSIAAGAVAAGASSFVKLEDAASADGDAGVPAFAILKATPADTAGTDGDYQPIQMKSGRVWVAANIDSINAVTPLMGAGNTGTGSLRVTLATDNAALATWGHGATAASVPANAVYQGKRGTTALPTAVSDAQSVGAMADKFGRAVTLIGTIRDLVGTQTTTISASTSETTIVTAAGSGVFADLVMLIISNTSTATNTRIDFRDVTAGSILFSLQSNGGQPPIGFSLPVPIPQTTANSAWTAQCATSTTDIRIYAVFAKNK